MSSQLLLAQAFASGALLHPVSDRPSFVDLTRALAAAAGVDLGQATPGQKRIAEFMGDSDHLVFVLVDGMGSALIELLPPDAFLRAQRMTELRAVYPSTTACALTTLATGLWPAQHGVPGWWSYVEERNLSVTNLPFVERYTETPLTRCGVTVDDLWPHPPWMKGMARDSFSILPNGIPESVFSRYSRGYTPGLGYISVPEATEMIVCRVRDARQPSYTYLYLPEFDSVCHDDGVDSNEASQALAFINRELERLAAELRGRARMIVSADHGHINVSPANRFALLDGDPMLELLVVPPTGEPRAPVLHVRAGCEKEFEESFQQRFGESFVLLPGSEVASQNLLGPEPTSPLSQRRFGHYMAIAIRPATLKYKPPQKQPKPDHTGYHAGLSAAEMRIPLIVV